MCYNSKIPHLITKEHILMVSRYFRYAMRSMALGALYFVLKRYTWSMLIGSQAACFHMGMFIAPFLGGGTIFMYGLFSLMYKVLSAGVGVLCSPTLIFSVYHIPTMCGAFYIDYCSRSADRASSFMKYSLIALNIAAGMLFWVHPVGRLVVWYTVPWLLPLGVLVTGVRHELIRAFGLAWLMHGVGSALWIWTHTMTEGMWWGLIPVSWAERTVLAMVFYMMIRLQVVIAAALPMIQGYCARRMKHASRESGMVDGRVCRR
jgi:hypothetical protein